MKKIIIVFMIFSQFFLLTACNSDSGNGSGNSYQAIVMTSNGERWSLNTNEKPEDYTQFNYIMTVTHKTKPNRVPTENGSNYFEEGTKIYSVKDSEDLAIAIAPSGEKSMLRRNKE